jgi:hypothetical protein
MYTHDRKTYREHAMRLTALCFFALALLTGGVPVSAQQGTPVPPASSAQAIVSDVIEATQTLGILTVVVLVALGILAAIVVIVLVIAWKGISPLLSTIKSLNDAREDLQSELFKRLEAGDKERAKTAEINERTVNTLTTFETRTEAQAARSTAVEQITAHTENAVQPIKEAADKTLTTITEVERQLKTLATKAELQEAIRPIQESMEKLRETIETQLINPPAPAPTGGDAPVSGEETP